MLCTLSSLNANQGTLVILYFFNLEEANQPKNNFAKTSIKHLVGVG